MQYKDTRKGIREIAAELGVATILEGSVRRSADQVRIVGQLIDARTEEHLWAETYDRELTDIFAVQSDVAQMIAGALKATLTPEEESHLERKPTENLEAYDYYLRGNYFWDNYATLEGNEKAAWMYEKAVELDPEFTLAYARLAITHATLYSTMAWDHTPERLEQARVTLEKALELNPDLPEVYHARGFYYRWCLKDFDRALEQFEIALQKQPNNSEIIYGIGWIYYVQRKMDQAEKYWLRAYELNPQALNPAISMAQVNRFQRNWSEAKRWINIALSTHPEYDAQYDEKARIYVYGYGDLARGREVIEEGMKQVEPHLLTVVRWELEILSGNYQGALAVLESDTTDPRHLHKGYTLYLLGEADQARAYYDSVRVRYESLVQREPDNDFYHSSLAWAYAGLGRKDAAAREGKLAVELYKGTIARASWNRWSALAHIYIQIGEYEQAMDELERLLSIPSFLTWWRLKLDPIYDPLREHPRFQQLIADHS
jgi:serine/threonine-protein kinase